MTESTATIIPFAQQHYPTPPRVVGHHGTGRVIIDCECGWEGRRQPTLKLARRTWRTHRDAALKLSEPQLDALHRTSAGPATVNPRTGAPLVRRGLLVRIGQGSAYDITPAGRGVLAEYRRVSTPITAHCVGGDQ
jgi:hypothetical protein